MPPTKKKPPQKSDSLKSRLIKLLETHRGLVILLFCLPASFLFDLVLRTWVYLERKVNASRQLSHSDRVAHIQAMVHAWKTPPPPRKLLCSARPNWQSLSVTFFNKTPLHQIPLTPLHNILSLNKSSLTITVEPLVTVGEVTSFLTRQGYTLEVCLEINDATLGGLAMGVGMTTYSHKVGLYQESIVSMEVILGDGSLVTATATNEHSDLFYALPWSHGSLGFLTALELKVVPAKEFVKLRYIPVKGQKEYCDLIREISGTNDKDRVLDDFVEATVFSKDQAVVMVGGFSSGPSSGGGGGKINRVTKWYKPWFYKHVESILHGGKEVVEYIPLKDYLLRHNRAIFWVVESMIPFGNHPIFRVLFGWLLPPKPAFLKYTTTPGIRAMTFTKQVFQDIVLPINKLEEQIDIAERLFDTWPILVYPCRIYDRGEAMGQLRPPRKSQLVPSSNYGMFNDLGVYGVPGPVKRKERFDAVGALREMEKFTRDVGGYAFLYADIFMDRKEFEEMFDLTLYERVRKKYHAEGAFPHLYDKVKPEIDVFKVGEEWQEPL